MRAPMPRRTCTCFAVLVVASCVGSGSCNVLSSIFGIVLGIGERSFEREAKRELARETEREVAREVERELERGAEREVEKEAKRELEFIVAKRSVALYVEEGLGEELRYMVVKEMHVDVYHIAEKSMTMSVARYTRTEVIMGHLPWLNYAEKPVMMKTLARPFWMAGKALEYSARQGASAEEMSATYRTEFTSSANNLFNVPRDRWSELLRSAMSGLDLYLRLNDFESLMNASQTMADSVKVGKEKKGEDSSEKSLRLTLEEQQGLRDEMQDDHSLEASNLELVSEQGLVEEAFFSMGLLAEVAMLLAVGVSIVAIGHASRQQSAGGDLTERLVSEPSA